MVTGASAGIGRATAARLVDAGHVVFAAARQADALRAVAATHHGVRPVVLDITEPASIDWARHHIDAETGGYGPDVIVNAAGVLVLGPVETTSEQQTRHLHHVHPFLVPRSRSSSGRVRDHRGPALGDLEATPIHRAPAPPAAYPALGLRENITVYDPPHGAGQATPDHPAHPRPAAGRPVRLAATVRRWS